ncbi:DUF397 domain-containing protein [Streptomyces sp. NBC_00239]|uniref:DUF397 domain-containing protein n=1 Tax=Streptomyces sp. NBC_00239 TaxID=2903640 RepID=UPI002E28B93A|nr:DUF397 domain-containing protein [Streptomyces sp. NBC_00239]
MTVQKPDPSTLDLSDVEWQVPSFDSGGGGNCMRFARKGRWILVGDTENPDGDPLVFSQQEFEAAILGAKAGEFDHLAGLG